MDMKRCPKCGQIKPLDAFNRSNQTKDGRKCYCRECTKAEYVANRVHILAQKVEYQQRNREAIAARNRARYLIIKDEWNVKRRQAYAEHKDEILTKNRQRYANDPAYQERCKQQAREWREAHPEKVRETNSRWVEAHREHVRRRQRRAYEANKDQRRQQNHEAYIKDRDHRLAYTIAWRKENKDKCSQYEAKRRAQKANGGNIEAVPIDRNEIIARDNATCWICGAGPLESGNIHLDHVIPLCKGGSHTPDNMRVACRRCNMRKHTRLPHELKPILTHS